jgi:hypothetical protein
VIDRKLALSGRLSAGARRVFVSAHTRPLPEASPRIDPHQANQLMREVTVVFHHPIHRKIARSVLLVGALAIAALQPAATLAADGQVLATGSDVASNVFISSGHARVNFANLGDCPNGQAAGSCWMEVRFKWHCAEPWCVGWSTSSWYKVPVGQDFFAHPGCADGSNSWIAESRMHIVLPNANTLRIRGGYEANVGGNALIGKYLFNVSLNSGYNGGVLIDTVFAANIIEGEGVIAESNGNIAGPSSC